MVVGAAQGYLDAGYRIGVYSTPYIWESLVGDLALGVPEWRAAGQTSTGRGRDRCGRDWLIQGGEAVLGQWVQDGRDKNITCPGDRGRPGAVVRPARDRLRPPIPRARPRRYAGGRDALRSDHAGRRREDGPGKADGRQVRWDRHNQVRRQHIIDAAIEVLGETEPGGEVHVQQIADRAGLSRTVVYRHFTDRADLDAAVQGAVLGLLRAELVPALSFEGTPVEIIRRIVAAYVGWAAAHPSLHEFAQADPAGGRGPGPDGTGHRPHRRPGRGPHQRRRRGAARPARGARGEALDPLVFGLVGAVFTSVRRWLSRPERRPTAEQLVDLVTEAIWFQIAGMARARGVELDPDTPVERLLEAAFDGAAE